MTNIEFPDTLIKIECGFNNCTRLDNIELPESLKFFECELYNTGITELEFPTNCGLYSCYYGTGIKKVKLNNLEQLKAFCENRYYAPEEEDAYRVKICYDGKEFHSLTGELPFYTPYLMGYCDEDELSERQKSALAVLKAVEFKPDQDSFNLRVFKANLIVNSILSQVRYGDDTTKEKGIGKKFSDTVYSFIGGISADDDSLGFVCQNYATVTDGIYNLFGIPSLTERSTALNHEWQIVRGSNGIWLPVDNVGALMAKTGSYIDDAIDEAGGFDVIYRYISNIIDYGGIPSIEAFGKIDNLDIIDTRLSYIARALLIIDYCDEENKSREESGIIGRLNPNITTKENMSCSYFELYYKWCIQENDISGFRSKCESFLPLRDGTYDYDSFNIDDYKDKISEKDLSFIMYCLASCTMNNANTFEPDKLNKEVEIKVGACAEAVIMDKGDDF